MKRISALFLLLTKSTLLVLMSSMSLWGVHAMDMSMPNCPKMMKDGMFCQVCELAKEKWSEPFVYQSEKKEIKTVGFVPVDTDFFNKPLAIFSNTKIIKITPRWEYRSSYLAAKKQIVLIV